jgi:hypothetical protein
MIVDGVAATADKIPFDDLHGLPDRISNLLAARGVVFVTEFKANGRRYTGNIVARSWADAKVVAFGRGLGESVVGKLVGTGTL